MTDLKKRWGSNIMTEDKGAIQISDGAFIEDIRRIRLKINRDLEDILDEYADLEEEIRSGGIKELGTAKKNMLKMLIEVKRAKVDVINKQIANAKDSQEINSIVENFKQELLALKEAQNGGTKRFVRPGEKPKVGRPKVVFE